MYNDDEYRKEIKARSDRFLACLGQIYEDEMLERFDRLAAESPDVEIPAELEAKIFNKIKEIDKEKERKRRRKVLKKALWYLMYFCVFLIIGATFLIKFAL